MEYFQQNKEDRNEVLIHAATRMSLRDIILSERSKKAIYCMI